MNPARLQTRNLELVLSTVEETLEGIEAMPEENKKLLSPEWLELAKNATTPSPWIHGFSMNHRSNGSTVGECGFKGPPSREGMVEIAYIVQPEQQCKGYATEAARALVEFAFSNDDIKVVWAHTLPESNASTRVLTKCNFQNLGEVVDPEDGVVWRWEKRAPEKDSDSR